MKSNLKNAHFYLPIIFHQCINVHFPPVSRRRSQFTKIPVGNTVMQHKARMHLRHLHDYFQCYYDRILPNLHLSQTITLQEGVKVVKNTKNHMSNGYMLIRYCRLDQYKV